MKISKIYYLFLINLMITGCATEAERDPVDPLEPLNRAVESFNNDLLDPAFLKPAATLYNHLLPAPFIESINNFFSNINELTVIINDVLQGKFQQGLQDSVRFVYNTTFGLGGLFDIASNWGITKHNEDFGQTLGYWGVGAGPYLVLPILGPRTTRDAIGSLVEYPLDLTYQIEANSTKNGLIALRTVNTRAELLGAGRVLEAAALDRYLFLRDAYLQHRENLVHDGQPPKDN